MTEQMEQIQNGIPPAAEAAFSGGQRPRGAVRKDSTKLAARLQQSCLELAALKAALAMSAQQSLAAQREVEQLSQCNSFLTQELSRLSEKEAKARHFAYHDELTGLPNRRLLLDRLNQAIAQGARQHKRVALLFFDLDGFKSINDRLGHWVGDNLLLQVAQRLSACLRSADTACRYGGDEFIVMLPEIDGRDSAEVVEQKIRTHLAAPYIVDGSTITATASIGTAVYPVDGKNYRDLIRQADTAMYHAKTKGGAVPSLFTLAT